MAVAKRLIAALLAMLIAYMPGPVWAAYATLTPPPGWSQGGSGAWKVAYRAGDTLLSGLLKKPFTPKDWGGGAAKMTVGFRYATGASRAAAFIIGMHPAVRLAIGVGSWIALGKVFFNESSGQWEEEVGGCAAPCFEYKVGTTEWLGSATAACNQWGSMMNASGGSNSYSASGSTETICTIRRVCVTYCGATPGYTDYLTYTVTKRTKAAVEPTRVPISVDQMADKVGANPMPVDLPSKLPEGSELPVDKVVLNPGPGTDMTPHTMRIPTGDPVPTSDPTKWRQPWVDVVPSPTTDNPWRVNVIPGETLQDNPDPMPDPLVDPVPDPNAKPKDDQQQDLCEKHPEVLACQKIDLGELSPETVPNEDKTVSLTPDTGWGPSGSCPAPRTVNLHGGLTLSIPLDLMCEFARMIRPLIVAAAYLGAAMMLVGAARKD